MATTTSSTGTQQATLKGNARLLRRLTLSLLVVTGVVSFGYAGISAVIATQLIYVPQKLPVADPGSMGLSFKNIVFPSRDDHVPLQGWFIPGVLPDGRLTTQRTIIVVHGTRANRADPSIKQLNFIADVVKQGFAVLAFDMRGNGASPPAPLSLGYFEQRDVLGAVDYLRSGPLPYPTLGRPRVIGGWGVSMGAATLLFAAAQEPIIRAVVSDSAYADIIPILQREIPKGSGLPAAFNPGALTAVNALYGINFSAVRPVDVVPQIAPRPIFFIHGAADTYVPPSNMTELASAASKAPNAHIQTWLVPGANHAQSYKVAGADYTARVVAFFTATLGPNS
jgi:uncharacterized protein